MEVECPRHPGASTIGSQLLDEITPMAGKSWHLSHKSPHRREEGHSLHKYIQWKQERGEPPRIYERTQNGPTTNMGDPNTCEQQKTAVTYLPVLAQSMHWCGCTNGHSKMQGNADPWWMHWRKCLTRHCCALRNIDMGECIAILQTLFVVNKCC